MSLLRSAVRETYSRLVKRYPSLGFAVGWHLDGTVKKVPSEKYTFRPDEKDIVQISDGHGTVLHLPRYHQLLLFSEYRGWKRDYVPSNQYLSGKVVLDVGAGGGETAKVFFDAGARKVIAVESSIDGRDCLEFNRATNKWNMEILFEPFAREHLKLPFDFMKMDIEGGEEVLLDPAVSSLPPCRMELHPEYIGEEKCLLLAQKFNLRQIVGRVSGIWGNV